MPETFKTFVPYSEGQIVEWKGRGEDRWRVRGLPSIESPTLAVVQSMKDGKLHGAPAFELVPLNTPRATGDRILECPAGHREPLEFREDVVVVHEVLGRVAAAGVVCATSSGIETANGDAGTNGRLYCPTCRVDFPLPPGTSLELLNITARA